MTLLTPTEPTFTKKFTLTLTVEGSRLQDIDDGLVEAAGERLKARMVNPVSMPKFVNTQTTAEPAAPSTPAPTVSRETVVDDIGNPMVVEGPRKRGRKPGQKVGPYKKQGEVSEQEQSETASDDGADTGETENDTPQSAPNAPIAATQKVTAAEDAVNALKMVNSHKNVDAARACLEKFGVKRCGELTDENRGQFIAYCESICK